MVSTLQKWSMPAGQAVARYSLVVFFLLFGVAKFTAAEAATIHPLLVHSPFLFWLPLLFDQQVASNMIGVIEIVLGAMVAARPIAPRICTIGSYGIALSLIVTLSFLITTPKLDPALSGFIIKDLTLLGVALWSAGEAAHASAARLISKPVPA